MVEMSRKNKNDEVGENMGGKKKKTRRKFYFLELHKLVAKFVGLVGLI